MSDRKDDDSSKEKKPIPKRVVVTYGGEKKKATEVPQEIQPQSPKVVVSSPVDIGAVGITHQGDSAQIKSQLHPKIPDEIAPREKPMVEPGASAPAYTTAAPVFTSAAPSSPPPTFASKSSAGTGSFAHVSIPPSPPPPPPPPPPSGYESARGGINAGSIALFLSLLSSIAIIALIFYAYLSQQEFYSLKAQSRDDQSSVTALVGQAKTSLEQLEHMRVQHQQSQEALQSLKSELESASQKMVVLSHNREWVLSEVNYLVFMANQRLHIAQDIPTALMQLKSADERIRTLGDPSLLNLKLALQKDIAQLLAYPILDTAKLWEEIGKLNGLVNQLHFKTLGDYLEKSHTSDLASPNDPAWLRALKNTWKEFKSLILITKEDDNTIPQALSLQEKAQVVRTIELLINEAQWAALNREAQIYQNSLQTIAVKAQQYFTDNQEQQVLLNMLTQLVQNHVDFKIPELTDTLNALSTINKNESPVPAVSQRVNP